MHSLAVPYALDALDPDETRRFEKHLATCARCTDEVRALAADTAPSTRITGRTSSGPATTMA
ncbi:zf-HC2 domain-containing protein, partial [Streptomyces spectabilis]|uniref:zf-HC2 domain-containing protein n=1 Tax=Streptomyces spectabilis TaxID=68270 RepID=UPI003400C7C6